MSLEEINNNEPICPECLSPTDTDELDMFGGLCEECAMEYNEIMNNVTTND